MNKDKSSSSRRKTPLLVALLALFSLATRPAVEAQNGTRSRIFALHITDLHIDEKISPTADPNTYCHGAALPPGRGASFASAARRVAHYGYRGCDSAPALVADAFRFISSRFGIGRNNGSGSDSGSFLLESQPETSPYNDTLPVDKVAFVLWTGDTGRHDKDLMIPREEEGGVRTGKSREATVHLTLNSVRNVQFQSSGSWPFRINLQSF
jgi:hypothetical protein